MPITEQERDEIMRLATSWADARVDFMCGELTYDAMCDCNEALRTYLDSLTQKEPSDAG